jgi:hypothetical protein
MFLTTSNWIYFFLLPKIRTMAMITMINAKIAHPKTTLNFPAIVRANTTIKLIKPKIAKPISNRSTPS